MFYLTKIDGQIMDLKPLKDDSTVFVQIKLFEHSSIFPLLFSKTKAKHLRAESLNSRSSTNSIRKSNIKYGNSALLSFLRLYYMYSISNDLSEFFKSMLLEISIIEVSKYQQHKLLGKSYVSALSDFIICDKKEIKNSGFATRHTVSAKLFIKDLNAFYDIFVIVGIAYDGYRDTANIGLKKFEDQKIYYPENDYFTSDLLPSEWMEMFGKNEELQRKDTIFTMSHYEPNLSPLEFELEKPQNKFNEEYRTRNSRISAKYKTDTKIFHRPIKEDILKQEAVKRAITYKKENESNIIQRCLTKPMRNLSRSPVVLSNKIITEMM